MALPTITELKAVLRVQTTAEDTALTLMLTQAQAAAEAYLRRPILATARSFAVEQPSQYESRGILSIFVPLYPIVGTVQGVDVTDADGDLLVEDTDFSVWYNTGELLAISPFVWDTFPYVIDCNVGLEASADYATTVEPAIGAAILDIASDLWHRRNPTATSEGTGGGVSTSYDVSGLPKRAVMLLAPWRMPRAR